MRPSVPPHAEMRALPPKQEARVVMFRWISSQRWNLAYMHPFGLYFQVGICCFACFQKKHPLGFCEWSLSKWINIRSFLFCWFGNHTFLSLGAQMNPFAVFPALSHSCPQLPHTIVWRCSLDSPPHLLVSFNNASLSLSLSSKWGRAEPLRDLHNPRVGLGPGWHQLFFPEPPLPTPSWSHCQGKGWGGGGEREPPLSYPCFPLSCLS